MPIKHTLQIIGQESDMGLLIVSVYRLNEDFDLSLRTLSDTDSCSLEVCLIYIGSKCVHFSVGIVIVFDK